MYKTGGKGRKYKIIILRVVKFSRETLFCCMMPSAYLRHLHMMINLSNEKNQAAWLLIFLQPSTLFRCRYREGRQLGLTSIKALQLNVRGREVNKGIWILYKDMI